MEASWLRATAFSFSAAVFNSTMACSQLRGTPSPLTYMAASRTGAVGLPLAVAFHSQAASAAESLALSALANSSAPGTIFLTITSWSSSAAGGDGFGLPAVGLAAGPGGGDPAAFDLSTMAVAVVVFAGAAFCSAEVAEAFGAGFFPSAAAGCPTTG